MNTYRCLNPIAMCREFIFSTLFILLFLLVSHVQANPQENSVRYEKALSMYHNYRKSFPQVREISADKALILLSDTNVVFVDAREPEEQKVSMIPGAVTQKEFLSSIDRYRKMKIVAYCTIGYRSGKLSEKLTKKGFDVWNLQAGLLGWVHVNGPLENDQGPTETLHVYGKRWNLAPSWIKAIY